MNREMDTMQEKERILCHVSSSSNLDFILEVLTFLVSEEVLFLYQYIIYVLAGISLEGHEVARKWLKENGESAVKKIGTGVLFSHFIIDIISPFSSNAKADKIVAFFSTRLAPSFAMNLEQSLERLQVKARWAERKKACHLVKELLAKRAPLKRS
ncbi:hypothetical protein MLD38_005195 [Melastoma candidum]|uniref:Uncharacterized protein n=1 Tax=Melastoma candidum TaxID=119954 RepID=A0ACB9SA04_9MYRT|nr:hypothetical protein MLD38_005195 [Melastoma candidum]